MLSRNIEFLENKLVNGCISSLLTKNDLSLLHLVFNGNPTQEMLDDFLKTYDIEVAGGYKALMLSYFMHMHTGLNFTRYETPRLKGLFNFYRFQNMKLISYFMKIGKVFNQNNIKMTVLKGFAMRCLRPELSRAMSDIDILVPKKDFIKSIKLVKKMGYRLDIYIHSIDIHEPESDAGILDIHRYINLNDSPNAGKLNKFLFKRAVPSALNGIKFNIPSNEDLLFLALVNLAQNLKCKTSKPSTLYVLFDCKYLLEKPDFDFNIILKNVKLTHTQSEIALAIRFINTIIPRLIPEQLAKPFEKHLKNKCIEILFERYFAALQRKSRGTKIKQVINKKISIAKYLKLKMHYKYCKLIVEKKQFFVKKQILEARER